MANVEDTLRSKLEELSQRFDHLTEQMQDPAIASDATKIVALAKEHSSLSKIVGMYRNYRTLMEQMDEAQGILADPSADGDMRSMANEEIGELKRKSEAAMEEVKGQLVMSDDESINSVMLEIRAGTGGEEAALFVHDLLDMYRRYCEGRRWSFEVMAASGTDMGGFREVVVNVKGEGAWSRLGYEGGGHRVQRVPETEAQGRIHTSAATVAVLPEPENIEIQINWDKDVLEHTSRAGGPGGQSVNKVESAIKLEHIPTGITVSMRDEKSQHKNRAKPRAGRPRVRTLPQPAGRRRGRRPQGDDRFGRPLATRPHLQLPAEPLHRSPPQGRGTGRRQFQPRPHHRRRHGRAHRRPGQSRQGPAAGEPGQVRIADLPAGRQVAD